GGRRVPKYHSKIEAYGTIDELISYIGLLRDYYENNYYKEFLIDVQDKLMTCSALLAADCDGCEDELPQINSKDITKLEKEIDKMEEKLPPLKSFVLPGGHPVVSFCHITRTICRRAERITIRVAEEFKVDELVIKYLNRLSDFFFVFSRLISKDLGAEEIPWKPKL
ncbi:MAG: cob(I)yrinic acid a,c-diamide adenosyltransferase, partial [Bacteroidales bacterium]